MTTGNPYGAEQSLKTESGEYRFFNLNALADHGFDRVDRLPYSIRVLLESCLRNLDGFVVSVLGEQGIDMHRHQSRPFDVHSDGGYDLIIALSKQAEGEALNAMRAQATEVEGWDVLDPSLVDGTRDMKLDAYRETRDQIRAKIKGRFDFS